MPHKKSFDRERVRLLASCLPEPEIAYSRNNAVFTVYKVKDMYRNEWISSELGELLIEARKSYYMFGDIPLLDAYDEKSAIYLVRVEYEKNGPREEWASTRLVPGDGKPGGIEDLDFFHCGSKDLGRIIKERLFKNKDDYLSSVVASSRTCATGSYNTGGPVGETGSPNYTALCFALVHYRFAKECMQQGAGFEYMAGTVVPKFVQKALSVDGNTPCFMPSARTLKLQEPHRLSLNRNYSGHYIYRFPLYFLDREQLLRVIKRLIDLGKLSPRTIACYMDTEKTFEELRADAASYPGQLRNLGKLLTAEGLIKYSSMTGSQLRRIIAQEVEDAPVSCLTPVALWNQSIENMLFGEQEV